MKQSLFDPLPPHARAGASRLKRSPAFSMIEVVLAVGIFAFAILALLGLLAPSLHTAAEVIDSNKATAVMSKVSAFLNIQRFDTVYSWVANRDKINLIAYTYTDPNSDQTFDKVLEDNPNLKTEIENSRGTIFKITLRASQVNPEVEVGPDGEWPSATNFKEGFLALEVRVYTLPKPEPPDYILDTTAIDLLLIYNTAIAR